MDSALATSSTFLPFQKPNSSLLLSTPNPFTFTSKKPLKFPSGISISAKFSPNHSIHPSNGSNDDYPFARTLRTATGTLVLTVAATLMAAKFKEMPARAEPVPPIVEAEAVEVKAEVEGEGEGEILPELSDDAIGSVSKSPLMESSSECVDNLKGLLQKNLEIGENEEALKILGKLVEAQPSEMEWKFLKARVLSEMGRTQEARDAFEEILALNPLSFEALFENALLMDRNGEGNAVIGRLEKALRIAEDENKAKEARDVKLIMAQIQFLRKNLDEALRSYEELSKEDPKDFRPYFGKGMIYSLLDRNTEAKEQFDKYKELSPKKFEADGYLRSTLSSMKRFGNDS